MYKESIPSVNDNGAKDKKNKIIIILFALLPILFVVLFFYAYQKLVIFEGHEIQPKDEVSSLEGEIYLTLAPMTGERPILGVYSYDLSTKEMKAYFEHEDEVDNMMASFSSEFDTMTFVRRYSDYSSQVLVLQNKELIEVSPRYGLFERNPKISPDKTKVVYWYFESSENPLGAADVPEENFIVMSELVNNPYLIERIKGRGAFPTFTPDGEHLVFLKNDGLYTRNLFTDEENLALELELDLEGTHGESPTWLSFRYNISPDGKNLVVTDSMNAHMYLYRIDSWSPFIYEKVLDEVFVQTPMWPVFSPCSNYFVMQTGLEISIFNLEGSKLETVLTLDEYYPDSVWVTDWIVK